MPNQNVRPNVEYMAIMEGDIIKPMRGATFFSLFAALSRSKACCLSSLAWAPKATTTRIEEKISNARAEASS